MKNIFLLLVFASLINCDAQNNSELIAIQYAAQTRGFLVDLTINKDNVIYNNNQDVNTLPITKEQWKSLTNTVKTLAVEQLKNYTVPEELLAVDRVIMAEMTFTIANEKHRIEFIHGKPPQELEALVREIFSLVSE